MLPNVLKLAATEQSLVWPSVNTHMTEQRLFFMIQSKREGDKLGAVALDCAPTVWLVAPASMSDAAAPLQDAPWASPPAEHDAANMKYIVSQQPFTALFLNSISNHTQTIVHASGCGDK